MTDKQFMLIDKPVGWTSFDIVARLRTITGERRIGHAGTLDPFATGLLIVAIGRESTKLIDSIMGLDKTYEATFVIGATTETLDTESNAVVDQSFHNVGSDKIFDTIKKLTGTISQIPPMHSAIKHDGQPLYKLARQGKEIERKPREIIIYDFELTNEPENKPDNTIEINVRIKCSSGTYIRVLAQDLAKLLGTVGYVKFLRRVKIGNVDVQDATKIDEINTQNWQKLVKNLSNTIIDQNTSA
jgi:tRNA pseudouridine55 synthase